MNLVGINFHLNFLNELERLDAQRRMRLEFRLLRDHSNCFEIPEPKFLKLFRLHKHLVINLINEMQEFVNNGIRSTKIPFHLQVLACLNFYAYGSYQTGVGQDLNFAISQPSMSRIVTRISTIFAVHLLPRHVKFPVSEEEVNRTKTSFLEGYNFPGTIGAIDCTHIPIIAPPTEDEINPGIAYLNRKGYHSINVQGICDTNMIFMNINARYPGATHDAAIWEISTIHRHLKQRYENGERNTWLIGDSGYPLQPWLMTPIPEADPNTPEGLYTSRHCSTRNIIERCFGVLKQRFRCLSRHRVLHYSHSAAAKIIYACVVLHNICRKNAVLDINIEDENHPLEFERDALIDNEIDVLTEGRYVRRQLINMIANVN